jgi:hypothetical protein
MKIHLKYIGFIYHGHISYACTGLLQGSQRFAADDECFWTLINMNLEKHSLLVAVGEDELLCVLKLQVSSNETYAAASKLLTREATSSRSFILFPATGLRAKRKIK